MSSTGSDVCPFIGFFCFQETSSFPNSRDIEEIFKTNNTISLHVLWYVGKMLKSPAKRKIHSSLNLTMAPTSPFSPFSPGGPGKPCKGDKQTLWASKKGRSCAAALNCWSWKKKKNPQTCKYVSVELINNFETMSMGCYVTQNTLIRTEPLSVNTQLVRRDTYYN